MAHKEWPCVAWMLASENHVIFDLSSLLALCCVLQDCDLYCRLLKLCFRFTETTCMWLLEPFVDAEKVLLDINSNTRNAILLAKELLFCSVLYWWCVDILARRLNCQARPCFMRMAGQLLDLNKKQWHLCTCCLWAAMTIMYSRILVNGNCLNGISA